MAIQNDLKKKEKKKSEIIVQLISWKFDRTVVASH